MIHQVYSTLPTFKRLSGFKPGLNILLAEKTLSSTDQQTRNRAGKSSFVEIINFLLGGTANKNSIFRAATLVDQRFSMRFDLDDVETLIERSGKPRSKLSVELANTPTKSISQKDWCALLGQEMFGLDPAVSDLPTFRMLIPYFMRRREDGGFRNPESHSDKQQLADQQIALMFLLDLDWTIAVDWKNLRKSEKSLPHLKRAIKEGRFGNVTTSTPAYLRTRLIVKEKELEDLAASLQKFRVHEQYHELERESDELTAELNRLADENTLDLARIRDLQAALASEVPPAPADLEAIYQEAGIVLPDLVARRFDEVQLFHESVLRNRKTYLAEEHVAAERRVESRTARQQELDRRRSDVLRILQSHGALDQFLVLQGEFTKRSTEVESLRQQYKTAQELALTTAELKQQREHLLHRLNLDFSEREESLKRAILAYEEVSQQLYGDPGSMVVTPTPNGPSFDFEIPGKRSGGVTNMRIFCFDMMLMELCARRNIGPGFLIHDSHIFDGVDGRQIQAALRIGKERAEKFKFQYIVTLNEDDAFKEASKDFDLTPYILPTRLTDAIEDGGLFGVRFR